MPREKPKDIREAAKRAVESGMTYEQVAELLGIGRASVGRWMGQLKKTGTLSPKPRKGGLYSQITTDLMPILVATANELNHATDEELTAEFNLRSGLNVSRSSVRRALQRINFTRKKISRRAKLTRTQ